MTASDRNFFNVYNDIVFCFVVNRSSAALVKYRSNDFKTIYSSTATRCIAIKREYRFIFYLSRTPHGRTLFFTLPAVASRDECLETIFRFTYYYYIYYVRALYLCYYYLFFLKNRECVYDTMCLKRK